MELRQHVSKLGLPRLVLVARLLCTIDAYSSPPSSSEAVASGLRIPPIPTRMTVKGVSQSYPETLLGKLFSSVPKREFGLKDVDLSFGPPSGAADDETEGGDARRRSVALLVGASASGKSTLLRVISGGEEPKSGVVEVNGIPVRTRDDNDDDDGEGMNRELVKPVVVDRKAKFPDDEKSILEHIVSRGRAICAPTVETDLIEAVAKDLSTVLDLDDDASTSPPSALSPSSQYVATLVCASLESVAPSLPPDLSTARAEGVRCPILCLDELMDFEHPSIVRRVAGGLKNLATREGIVLVATHKPHHFDGMTGPRRVITLCGGRVLKDDIGGG